MRFHYQTLIFMSVVLILAPIIANGEEEEDLNHDWEVEVEGYISAYYDVEQEGFILGLNELEVEAELHPQFVTVFSIEGEYDFEENEAMVEINSAFLDTYFQERTDDPNTIVYNSGFTLGYFNVPFGLDYRFYEAPERWNVSSPLTAEMMFEEEWVDVGMDLFASIAFANLDVFAVNGYTEFLGVGATADLVPIDWVDFGGSYAVGMNADKEMDWDRYGGYGEVSYAGLDVFGEYIMGNDNKTAAEPDKHSGYYAQGTYDFSDIFFPIYVGARYGAYAPEFDANEDGVADNDDLTRITAYFGVKPIDPVTFKFEYQMNTEDDTIEEDNDEIWAGVVAEL